MAFISLLNNMELLKQIHDSVTKRSGVKELTKGFCFVRLLEFLPFNPLTLLIGFWSQFALPVPVLQRFLSNYMFEGACLACDKRGK